MNDLLEENAFIDAQEICMSHGVSVSRPTGREFVDADLVQYAEHGVNLELAAKFFVRNYEGDNSFVNNVLKVKLGQYRRLTQPQARAALNIMRQELLGIKREKCAPKNLACFSCDDGPFATWDELNAHKSQMHGGSKPPEVLAETGPAEIVIEDNTSTLGLDLSGLPDGRYAAPDPSGDNDYVFLMVTRAKVTKELDRRYRYGKIVTGREIVVAGTISVREWSSDSKEWVGIQRPGDVYRGQFEEQLQLVMMAPELWATLFGRLIGHCCICGKTLTDDVSRNIGMGLDCEKKQDYFKRVRYSYIGTDRPEDSLDKLDPNDERYLSGELRRYIEPPKPPAPKRLV